MKMLLVAATIAAASALVEQAPALRSQSSGAVSRAGPVYLLPDATRTALRTLEAGTIVRVGEIRGDWAQVTFNDAVLGPRSGWMERTFLTLPQVAEAQRATRKPEPAMPPTPPQPPHTTETIPAEPISPQGFGTAILDQRSAPDGPSNDPIATQAPAASEPPAASCAQSQAIVNRLLDAANARVENARLGNNAGEMRAAIDALQGIFRDVRSALAPCAAAKADDPHAGHAVATPAPAGAEPHGGHAVAAPAPAAADPHAGQVAAATTPDLSARIRQWLSTYDAAFAAKKVTELAAFYHPDVTVYEGTSVHSGWTNYRNTRLEPDFKSFEGLAFGRYNVVVTMVGGHAAYVTSDPVLAANASGKPVDLIGRETLVLEHIDGAWKIRHQQIAMRPRPVP